MQAPSADNPIAHFALARARQAYVLGRLVATRKLTQAQASRAFRQPLHLQHRQHAKCPSAALVKTK